MHNLKYEKWVKSLPCCLCGDDTKTDPHHLKGDNAGATLKADSFLCIPLCRKEHDELHAFGYVQWEILNGVTQWELAAKTMLRAIFEGILRLEQSYG